MTKCAMTIPPAKAPLSGCEVTPFPAKLTVSAVFAFGHCHIRQHRVALASGLARSGLAVRYGEACVVATIPGNRSPCVPDIVLALIQTVKRHLTGRHTVVCVALPAATWSS